MITLNEINSNGFLTIGYTATGCPFMIVVRGTNLQRYYGTKIKEAIPVISKQLSQANNNADKQKVLFNYYKFISNICLDDIYKINFNMSFLVSYKNSDNKIMAAGFGSSSILVQNKNSNKDLIRLLTDTQGFKTLSNKDNWNNSNHFTEEPLEFGSKIKTTSDVLELEILDVLAEQNYNVVVSSLNHVCTGSDDTKTVINDLVKTLLSLKGKDRIFGIEIVDATKQFLTNNLTSEDYQIICNKAVNSKSSSKRAVGIAMMVVGITAIIASLAIMFFSLGGNILPVISLLSGALSSATGFGLFYKNNHKNLQDKISIVSGIV